MDSPRMSFSTDTTVDSAIELIVATAAGKPLLHFTHLGKLGGSARSVDELISLSAACVAFRHATNSRIRSIVGPKGIILSTSFGALHVAVAGSDRNLPLDFLVSLAKIAVTSVFFLLSSGFMTALEARPTLDLGSKSPVVQMFVSLFLKRAVLFPLPPFIDASVSLPYPSASSTPKRLGSVLTSALRSQPGITHAIILSASPPFPHRIISSVSPVYNQLSPMDHFLISSLLPMRANLPLDIPERIFLQTFSFNKASRLFARLVELRLAPDDFADFKASVGEEYGRPGLSEHRGDAVWVIGIADITAQSEPPSCNSGKSFLDDVEKRLDRSRSAMDLMVHMERPWILADIFQDNPILRSVVLGVIVQQSHRLVATIGALDHRRSVEILHAMREHRLLCERNNICTVGYKDATFSAFRKDTNVWFVVNADRHVFVSGLIGEAQVIEICQRHIFPWLTANMSLLFSPHSCITLPPTTPLSFFLAPFES